MVHIARHVMPKTIMNAAEIASTIIIFVIGVMVSPQTIVDMHKTAITIITNAVMVYSVNNLKNVNLCMFVIIPL